MLHQLMKYLLLNRSQIRDPIHLFLLHQKCGHFQLRFLVIFPLKVPVLAPLIESRHGLVMRRFVQFHLSLIDKIPHSVSLHQYRQFYSPPRRLFYSYVGVSNWQYQCLLPLNLRAHPLRKALHRLLQSLIRIVPPFFLQRLLQCHQYRRYRSQ